VLAFGTCTGVLASQRDEELFPGGFVLSVCRRLGRVEQFAAALKLFRAVAVGQESVVPNADKAIGQDVHEKAADEFACVEGHGLFGRAVPVVLVREADLAVLDASYLPFALTGKQVRVRPNLVRSLVNQGELDRNPKESISSS